MEYLLTLPYVFSGKSESLNIRNEKGPLREEVDRMVAEAEAFAAEDAQHRKQIEGLNNLSAYVYGLKGQMSDKDGLSGRLDDDERKTILDVLQETTEWIAEYGQSATADDLEDRLAGT